MTKPEIIDADLAIRTLREVVKGHEDYVYTDEDGGVAPGALCAYFTSTGQPSCVVGQALAKLGFTKDDIDGHNFSLVGDLPIDMTPEAQDIFDVAQYTQDGGKLWGEALDRAEAYYRHVSS